MSAVEGGHPEVVKILVFAGADINAVNAIGQTALSISSDMGKLIITKILIRLGAKVEKPDSLGRTPLMMASMNGRDDEVKRLLRAGADINGKDHLEKTSLIMAAEKGNESTVKILRKAGALLNVADYYGMTALAYAARGGHIKTIRFLAAEGAKVNVTDRNGVTALGHAASSGYIGAINALLRAGADITGGKNEDKQAWSLARSEGYVKTYRMLKDIELLSKVRKATTLKEMRQIFLNAVKHGAVKSISVLIKKRVDINFRDNVSARDYSYLSGNDIKALGELAEKYGEVSDKKEPVQCSGSTALGLAAYSGIDSVVALLVKNGAEIDAEDSCGQTPLAIAVTGNHLNIALLLLTHGADVDAARRLSGASPLIMAAKAVFPKVAKALMAMGRGYEIKDKFGFTALHWAVIKKSAEITGGLLQHGAKTGAKDNLGFTALHWAAMNNDQSLVSALLLSHADPDIQSAEGRTPYELIADKEGFEKTASLLEKAKKSKKQEPLAKELSDEEIDPLKYFSRLKILYYHKWMAELFKEEGFCSYKTIKGPRYNGKSGAASASVECISKKYTGPEAEKKNPIKILVTREDKYNEKALAACGCDDTPPTPLAPSKQRPGEPAPVPGAL
ncbi:MAG TPA: hypothetical protein ENI77_10775, partial [Nitrospirae bacterium]|nr:hypothetical protein [Nitrospirota bacterium]